MAMLRHRALPMALVAALGSCGYALNGLNAKLVVTAPTETAGQYVLNFGTVQVGATSTLTITIEDEGRATLDLNAIDVAAPFSTSATAKQQVLSFASVSVPFTFAPTEAGAAKTTVTVTSNGGEATVILEGNGVAAPTPPATCQVTVSPQAIDFGTVTVGQTKTSSFNLTNISTGACELTALSLASGSDAAYSLISPPPLPVMVNAGGNVSVSVQVAPTVAEGSIVGAVLLTVGPPGGTSVNGRVPLQASSTTSPPTDCTFSITPTTLNFGSVATNSSKTLSFAVANTGTTTCAGSELQMGTGSASAFSIPAPPVVPFTLSGGHTLTVNVRYLPTAASTVDLGTVDINIGTPGMTGSLQTVTLIGSSPEASQGCTNPMPNGSCGPASVPPASAKIYIHSSTTLYSFNPTNNAVTMIADFNGSAYFDSMFDIAIDTTGVMAGIGESGAIYTIDPTTAACTQIATAPSSNSDANGLSFTPAGLLVVVGSEADVYDRSTGQFTNLVPSGVYKSWGDVVELPDGLLYWSVVGPNGSDSLLVTIDPSSGATNEVGDTGISNIWGLSYADGTLFGFTDDGDVVQINSTTAVATTTNIGGSWYGAATNPLTW